ncbi:hypothetical protein C7S18_17000 [Ahniella affigens]|uniref:Peptidase S8 n=1 Tax=Ahniella affigens TaxID=2021234 RepID=A0A2P1PVG4_9GAMM|nr:S8 family serine peptidase [Ahniella affigens]AVP98774.1 hypothetical protein C7S18_17000 [Ahniella affigens]
MNRLTRRNLCAAVLSLLPVSVLAAETQGSYLITFAEKGMLEHQQSVAPAERFNARSADARAYQQTLMAHQQAFRADMGQALSRSVNVTHYYLATHSGMAAQLTASEAQAVRQMLGVESVELAQDETMDTYRGPTFIGADSIWSGAQVPGGLGTKGEGMVIAVLDSGIVFPHPSFNDDAACGHGGANPPKVLSRLDCSSTDVSGLCNGANPLDTDGHGSHTASTSGGNTLTSSASPAPPIPAGFTSISGVAPCANLRIYKVCPGSTCPGADIQAGMNSVLLHGDVDVMNFSISGGRSPWTDNDRRKLDLVNANVLIAASAGNTSTSVPDPVGQVNHLGPWVMSVAASTHDAIANGLGSAAGPGTPPANTQNLPLSKGSASPNGTSVVAMPIRHFLGQGTAEGCTPGEDTAPANTPTIPAGFFNGAVALIQRGSCPFTKKVQNAFNAGAQFVIIRNNTATAFSMNTTGQPNVPAYSLELTQGNNLTSFVDANPTTATINITLFAGDVLANFSLRGPSPVGFDNLQKPNITGPGVNILAATTDVSGYGNLSGTSMSSPHLAGAAALIRDIHPTWSVPEVISALMTTSKLPGTDDTLLTPWDFDDVGTGRVDLTKAAKVGLVMNETNANFLAANPAASGDVRTLNLPSMRDMACTPSCTFTRTVRSVSTSPETWAVVAESPTGFVAEVSPSNFTIPAGGTQTLTFTYTPQLGETGASIRFAPVRINLPLLGAVEGGLSSAPEQVLTVAVKGVGPSINLFSNSFE